MRPKLLRIGYLPVFNMRLNRLIKSQESFMGVFLILEHHLIYYQYLELIVCRQFVECRIEFFIFNLIVKWTSDHFNSGFEWFSQQSLAFVYYSENSRSRLFKVIIKLLCAHCFSSLGISFFLSWKNPSYLSPGLFWVLEINQYLKHLFWWIVQFLFCLYYKVAPFFLSFLFILQ